MGTMAVMAELHQLPDLKLNLKFEVEVLCNTLTMDLKVWYHNILRIDTKDQ